MFLSQFKTVVSRTLMASLLSICFAPLAHAVTRENRPSTATSTPVTLDQLLSLSPLAQEMLIRMEREVPILGEKYTAGLGLSAKSAVAKKTIYLERDKIQNPECINKSFIAVERVPVACQNDKEIRFLQSWLDSHSDPRDVNKAGLIIHEFVLGWLQEILPEYVETVEKDDLERRVRIITREVFAENRKLSEVVADTVGMYALNGKTFAVYELGRKTYESLALKFCRDPRTDFVSGMAYYFKDSDFMWMMVSENEALELKDLQITYQKSNSGGSAKKAWNEKYQTACVSINAEFGPVHEPKIDKMPRPCVESILEAVKDYQELRSEFGILSEHGERQTVLSGISSALTSAFACTHNHDEQSELVNYFRFLTKK
jgi:hypothetical protein